jgi:hypothetical protein
MNLLCILALFSSVNLVFMKDSPDVMVRVIPEINVEEITIHYSFSGNQWGTTTVQRTDGTFDATLKTPDDVRVVGIYVVYGNNYRDDNDGNLYLYEVSIFPRFLMPISLQDLEVMLEQARKKISSGVHVSEAIRLLDYLDVMLPVLPYVENTPAAAKREILMKDVTLLKQQAGY